MGFKMFICRWVIWMMRQVLPLRSLRYLLVTQEWTAASLNTVTWAPRPPWPTTQLKSMSLTSWGSLLWTTCAWLRPANRRPSLTCCWRSVVRLVKRFILTRSALDVVWTEILFVCCPHQASPERSTRTQQKEFQSNILDGVMEHLLAADVLLGDNCSLFLTQLCRLSTWNHH